MIKERLDNAFDKYMCNTQYGFRKAHSTAQAIFLARRIVDIAEKEGTNLTMLLLDWEQAHERLMEALVRLNLPDDMIAIIGNT